MPPLVNQPTDPATSKCVQQHFVFSDDLFGGAPSLLHGVSIDTPAEVQRELSHLVLTESEHAALRTILACGRDSFFVSGSRALRVVAELAVAEEARRAGGIAMILSPSPYLSDLRAAVLQRFFPNAPVAHVCDGKKGRGALRQVESEVPIILTTYSAARACVQDLPARKDRQATAIFGDAQCCFGSHPSISFARLLLPSDRRVITAAAATKSTRDAWKKFTRRIGCYEGVTVPDRSRDVEVRAEKSRLAKGAIYAGLAASSQEFLEVLHNTNVRCEKTKRLFDIAEMWAAQFSAAEPDLHFGTSSQLRIALVSLVQKGRVHSGIRLQVRLAEVLAGLCAVRTLVNEGDGAFVVAVADSLIKNRPKTLGGAQGGLWAAPGVAFAFESLAAGTQLVQLPELLARLPKAREVGLLLEAGRRELISREVDSLGADVSVVS